MSAAERDEAAASSKARRFEEMKSISSLSLAGPTGGFKFPELQVQVVECIQESEFEVRDFGRRGTDQDVF